MMSIFIRTSTIFTRHPLYSPCTYAICRRGLYFVACKRSLQQASIVQCVMAVWLPLVEASLSVLFVRWLACGCSHSVCCIIKNIFPHSVFPIAHLSKTVGVVIFCFARVHLKHHATFSPCDRWPLPRKCSSSCFLSRQHACVS